MADSTYIEQVAQSVRKQPGLTVEVYTYVGDYDTLADLARKLKVGMLPTQSGTGTQLPADLPTDMYVANAEATREKGNRGRLSITLSKQEEDRQVWALDMMEIQKPIKTWGADLSDKPDLDQLSFWEAMKSKNEKNWINYIYEGSTKLTGNTLKLAQMIREGIETYAVYTPVITCTTRHNTIPSRVGANNGKVGAPSSNDANVDISELTALCSSWLKTCDRLTGSLDGTFTRVQGWTGADSWNENLYANASSASE